ncbi:MAG: GIY-YIG nuclease family protein [Roseiflexaceae bacterium]
MKGTYLLIMHLDRALADLRIGQLGRFDFAVGYYLYVGSAFGPGGVPARLAYHARQQKERPRWHIDYLRAHTRIVETWSLIAPWRLERSWATALSQLPALSVPAPRFGASDDDGQSHLFYAPRRPATRLLSQALLGWLSEHELAGQIALDIHTYEDR